MFRRWSDQLGGQRKFCDLDPSKYVRRTTDGALHRLTALRTLLRRLLSLLLHPQDLQEVFRQEDGEENETRRCPGVDTARPYGRTGAGETDHHARPARTSEESSGGCVLWDSGTDEAGVQLPTGDEPTDADDAADDEGGHEGETYARLERPARPTATRLRTDRKPACTHAPEDRRRGT